MIKEYIYIERLKKASSRFCNGDCNGIGSSFKVNIYINKARDLKETNYYCSSCAKLLYPRYFKKKNK